MNDARIRKLVDGISLAVTPELRREIAQLKSKLSKACQQRDEYRAKAKQYQNQLLEKRK